VIYASTSDTDAHRAELRAAFGETLSDQFVEVMMGKLISGLRPNPFDVLEEATLNAALAVVASFKPTSELEALLSTQAVIAGLSAFRMMELIQRHLAEKRQQTDQTSERSAPDPGSTPERKQPVNRGQARPYSSRCPGVVGIANLDQGQKRGGSQN